MRTPRSVLADGQGTQAGETTSGPVTNGVRSTSAFETLIAPLSRAAFLSEFWQNSFLHLSGERGRFQPLLKWDDLNSLIEQDCLEPPTFRLFQKGKAIDVNRYMSQGETKARVNAGGLITCLSEGATLIIDQVNKMVPRVRQLAEACEEALQADTNVNLYAGWRSERGFDLHWDDHDTIMLQLSGRKRWTVYRPTRLHPLREDIAPAEKPTGEPVWHGILEDGDMIYMPRGWWHVAYPLDEPSLHLTFGFKTLTGIDLLDWMVAKLREHEEVRADVPRLAGDATRKQYVAGLRKLLTEAWDDEEVLALFLRDWDSRRYARPRIDLPSAPMAQNAPLTMGTMIRLASQHWLSLERDGTGKAYFSASGRRWICDAELIPPLEALSDGTSVSMRDLCAKLPSAGGAMKLKVLLTALAMTGVILKEALDA